MAGPKKLSPTVVRQIFQSTDSAPATAKRFKVSPNLVYLIRDRRIHKDTTKDLNSPERARRSKSGRPSASARAPTIDADRLADDVTKRVLKELGRRLRA